MLLLIKYSFGDPNPKFNMSFINDITFKAKLLLYRCSGIGLTAVIFTIRQKNGCTVTVFMETIDNVII